MWRSKCAPISNGGESSSPGFAHVLLTPRRHLVRPRAPGGAGRGVPCYSVSSGLHEVGHLSPPMRPAVHAGPARRSRFAHERLSTMTLLELDGPPTASFRTSPGIQETQAETNRRPRPSHPSRRFEWSGTRNSLRRSGSCPRTSCEPPECALVRAGTQSCCRRQRLGMVSIRSAARAPAAMTAGNCDHHDVPLLGSRP